MFIIFKYFNFKNYLYYCYAAYLILVVIIYLLCLKLYYLHTVVQLSFNIKYQYLMVIEILKLNAMIVIFIVMLNV